MPEMTDQPTKHEAILGTGNGLTQFVCCRRDEDPFVALWVAPGGRGGANIFHTPRQAYDMVVRHLTHGQYDDARLAPVLEAAEARIVAVTDPIAEPYVRPRDDVRPAVQHLGDQLDGVTLTVTEQ